MKLQFNLLPDVKQEYLKTKRAKRTVITGAIIASSISFFILLFMLTNVYVINKRQLNNTDKDIEKYSSQLKSIPNLDKILTVQNQLQALSTLHSSKHETSRLYYFLPEVTPRNVHLSEVSVDLVANTMNIKGTAGNHKDINTFIDTLKFTTYKVDGTDTGKKAFPSVIESQFGLGKEGASYQLSIQFDPTLFMSAQKVSLNVPVNLSTTRSIMDNPSKDLFDGETEDEESNNDSNNTGFGE